MRELLRLVDQGIGDFLLREVQALVSHGRSFEGQRQGTCKGQVDGRLAKSAIPHFQPEQRVELFSLATGVKCRLLYGHTLVGLPEGALGLLNATST